MDRICTVQNPDADSPLHLVQELLCNTPDETLIHNCQANAFAREHWSRWFKSLPAHDGTAYLCGSGPSLADTMADIPSDGYIISLNGATKYMNKRGIVPSAQFICDARPENVELLGNALEHYFAAQCDPELFSNTEEPWLVHLQIFEEGPDAYEALCVPEDYPSEYSMLESTSTVGLQAMYLAYGLGFRKFELHGYDCSMRGPNLRVCEQFESPDATRTLMFKSRAYHMTPAMQHQLMRFFQVRQMLSVVTITVKGTGILPDMVNSRWSEQNKYEFAWQLPAYHMYSPGADAVATFVEWVRPLPSASVVDIGCGAGAAAEQLCEQFKFVLMVDFVNVRTRAKHLPFLLADITSANCPNAIINTAYGFCCDVMEHIPPEFIDRAIHNTVSNWGTFYRISTIDDVCGELFGQKLHLSVHPAEWWREKFESLGYLVVRMEQDGNSVTLLVCRQGSDETLL